MTRTRTRERQLRRIAERRMAERRRRRRNEIIALSAAALVAAAAGGLTSFLLHRRPSVKAGSVACGGEVPQGAGEKKPTFGQPPAMEIDTSTPYRARMETSCGTITLDLYADRTPTTVNSFVFLARKGFFDGLTFHRLAQDPPVIQGGDPQGTGSGGPGYRFDDEIVKGLTFDGPGVLAMANSGPDTNGSQFFITLGKASFLNGGYTIFGRVTEGMDVVRKIGRVPVKPGTETPAQTVYIERVTIEGP